MYNNIDIKKKMLKESANKLNSLVQIIPFFIYVKFNNNKLTM